MGEGGGCEVGGFVGVPECGLDAGGLPVDDGCDYSWVVVGNEYVSFVEVGVEERWCCCVLDSLVVGHVIYDGAPNS